MRRLNLRQALFVVGISLLAGRHFISHLIGAPPAQAAGGEQKAKVVAEAEPFSAQAKSLPFPADAREIAFRKSFREIRFTSGSSLDSLADFYQREMQKRSWEQDTSALVQEKERVEMTFKHDGAKVDVELRAQSGGEVEVNMECEGLDFAGTDDPAGLVAAGIPQPRAYLYLQKEIPRPESIRDVEYRRDECYFKASIPLQDAFDFYLNTLKGLGWQESRRPIVNKDRRYTEFKRGAMKLSVNIFSHEGGSRFILGYEDDRKDPIVPPLPTIAPASPKVRGTKSQKEKEPDAPSMPAINVSKNTGSATVTQGSEKFVLKHVAAYQNKKDKGSRTTLVFSDQPIPLQRMQQMLATKDDFSFGDLYEGALPNNLKIQVNGFTSFFFATRSSGVGDSIENSEHDIKVEQGRVYGTVKMLQPKKIFDEQFHVAATIDAVVMTPKTRLGSAPGSKAPK